MKVSAAALSALFIVAILGSPAHGSLAHESWDDEPRMVMRPLNPRRHYYAFYRPPDCCTSYTPRKIRCIFMKSYFVTTSGCSQPAVIFTTKRGQHICSNPNNTEVQDCVMDLKEEDSLELLSQLLTDKTGY